MPRFLLVELKGHGEEPSMWCAASECITGDRSEIREELMDDPRYHDMIEFLKSLGTDDIPHTDKPFLAHLISVYRDLERWGAGLDLCRAGMFHSIYGTEKFRHFSIPLDQRPDLQALIGERAERLAFYNCFMDRQSWDAIFVDQTGERKVVNRETGESYALSPEDFDDLTMLQICDWLEQVPRSQEWDYRREAYRKMAQHTGTIAVQEYTQAFAQETVTPES